MTSETSLTHISHLETLRFFSETLQWWMPQANVSVSLFSHGFIVIFLMGLSESSHLHKPNTYHYNMNPAVGFRDNHLPWASPPSWRSLYNPAKVNATVHGAPPDFTTTPTQAWQFPAWVGPEYNLSETKWLQPPVLQEALRSYMSNIAFTDHQLGRVFAALDSVG